MAGIEIVGEEKKFIDKRVLQRKVLKKGKQQLKRGQGASKKRTIREKYL